MTRRTKRKQFPSKRAQVLYEQWEENKLRAADYAIIAAMAREEYAQECGEQAGLSPGDFIAASAPGRDELPYVVIGFVAVDARRSDCDWGILCRRVQADGKRYKGRRLMTVPARGDKGQIRWRKIEKPEIAELLEDAT